MQLIKVSESTAAYRTVYFMAVNSADDTPYTGTFAAADLRVSKAGNAEASSAGTATHIANGLHSYAFTSTEVNTLGPIALRIARSGVYASAFTFQVVAFDPYSATTLGLSNLGTTAQADALLDRADGVETGLTVRQAMRLLASATVAKRSGAGTATEVYRNALVDNKNRITATVDASGNVTAITYDLT